MGRTLNLTLAALAVSALAGVVWWAGAGAGFAPAPPTAPATAPKPEGTAPPVEASIVAPAREAAVAPLDGATVEVLVVRGNDEAPVPNAAVWAWPPGLRFEDLPPEEAEFATRDPHGFREQVSPRLATDAQGRCRVPLAGRGTQVAAGVDGWWGTGAVNTSRERNLVRLDRDNALRVRVVGVAREPVAAVHVVFRRDGARGESVGVTDGEGRFVLRHSQAWSASAAESVVRVHAVVPGGESLGAEVDLAAPPSNEVVLTLPACGRVVVSLRDARDGALDPRYLGSPAAGLVVGDPSSGPFPLARDEGVSAIAIVGPDGRATFGAVTLGVPVTARAGFARSATEVGPTMRRPEVAIVAREGADDVVLVGTLLTGEGRPFAGRRFTVECRRGSAPSSVTGRTDDEGAFRVDVGPCAGDGASLVFDGRSAPKSDRLSVMLEGRTLVAGVNDLGELRIVAPRPVAAGRIVTDTGEPVPGVWLNVRRIDGAPASLTETIRADGAFVVDGAIAEGVPMRLSVSARSFVATDLVFTAGSTDLRVELRRGGSIDVAAFVDPAVPRERLQFLLRRTDAVTPARAATPEPAEPLASTDPGRCELRWRGLESGEYRFEAWGDDLDAPALAFAGLRVDNGPCADARLGCADLRHVRPIEVVVSAPEAIAPGPRASVVVRGRERWRVAQLVGGRALLASSTPLDLFVVAPGFAAKAVDRAVGMCAVALEPAPETRVRVVKPTSMPAEAVVSLRFVARAEAGDVRVDSAGGSYDIAQLATETVSVGAAGAATVRVPFARTYDVEAHVTLRDPPGRLVFETSGVRLPSTDEVRVEILEEDWAARLSGSASKQRIR
ncbi:MAG: hypothetical protein JNK78_02675 [Planctomycetes bacterium]|nr:hypothetical protein [Planctomycetota bacterium]